MLKSTKRKRDDVKSDKKKKKRQRYDTFWHMTDEMVVAYFQKILDGEEYYYIDTKAAVKKDGEGTKRTCWRAYNSSH